MRGWEPSPEIILNCKQTHWAVFKIIGRWTNGRSKLSVTQRRSVTLDRIWDSCNSVGGRKFKAENHYQEAVQGQPSDGHPPPAALGWTLMRLSELKARHPWYVTNLRRKNSHSGKSKQSKPTQWEPCCTLLDADTTLRIVSLPSLICHKPWSPFESFDIQNLDPNQT